jgi:hypothetical protein
VGPEGTPFLSVRGASDYAGSAADSRRFACCDVAFPIRPQGRHPVLSFRSSTPGPLMPLSTLRKVRLAAHPARLEVKMVRYSFLVRLLHSLLHAGLSRRSGASDGTRLEVAEFRDLPEQREPVVEKSGKWVKHGASCS